MATNNGDDDNAIIKFNVVEMQAPIPTYNKAQLPKFSCISRNCSPARLSKAKRLIILTILILLPLANLCKALASYSQDPQVFKEASSAFLHTLYSLLVGGEGDTGEKWGDPQKIGALSLPGNPNPNPSPKIQKTDSLSEFIMMQKIRARLGGLTRFIEAQNAKNQTQH
jgi:hypothetical protein